MFPCVDPGFQVIKDIQRKFRKNFMVFCEKNQDFMQKILFFPILGEVPGAPHPPLVPGTGSDNNSM